MAAHAGERTVVHELGHWLEAQDADVHRKALSFLEQRTAGESLQSLSKLTGRRYGFSERARPDRFPNPYTGKDYGGRATEVVSMGVEEMFADPVDFVRKDRGHFEFMVDLLRGR